MTPRHDWRSRPRYAPGGRADTLVLFGLAVIAAVCVVILVPAAWRIWG